MCFLQRLLVSSFVLILSACGGDSSPIEQSANVSFGKSTAYSEGSFSVPITGEEFGGNLIVDFNVSDLDGLKDVSLSFNQQSQRYSLCSMPEYCSGTQYEATIGGIYPGDFAVNPGSISLGLWVTDQTNTEMLVSSVEVYWQPQHINGVEIQRSLDGSSIDVSWETNPQLLRYNIYLAAQSGVNQYTFSQLDEGQAVLAIDGQQHLFDDLNSEHTYYILLAGIDGSGESAFTPEYQVQSESDFFENGPLAEDDEFSIFQNTQLVIAKSSGLLINDFDPDGGSITVDIQPVIEPSFGSLVLLGDGSFNYTPVTDFVGVDTFSYQILDPDQLVATATVTITVQPVPEALLGDSLSMTGQFLYIGLGEHTFGSGIGTGLYRIGDCIQLVDTYCSMTGDYVESAGSGNQPNQLGNYAFIMTYSGTGNSPVQVSSVEPGSNELNFTDVGDALFELYLFPEDGGVIKSISSGPESSTLLNFDAFIETGQDCTGLSTSQGCNIGNVGLTAEASVIAPLDRLDFIVSGFATVDISNDPVALDDEYEMLSDVSSLTTDAPGVLANDTDADFPLIGDTLSLRNQIWLQTEVDFVQPVALAADEYRQLLYVYDGLSSFISVFDRIGHAVSTVSWQGEGANSADLDLAPVAFSLSNTLIPQGSLLMFNGETQETEIYAVDPHTDTVLAVLNTEFGNSHVVGGAFNPITNTIFLLQDNLAGSTFGNLVAEIDPNNGQVLSTFLLNDVENLFDVRFGDLDVNNVTGSLYLVSSLDNRIVELNRDGKLIRYIPLPDNVSSLSGIAVSNEADRVWFVNNSTSSLVLEMHFTNQGNFPGLVSSLLSQAKNGFVTLNLDGSFTYTPTMGFNGQDSFVYQVSDQTGKVAQAEALITVLNVVSQN